MSAKRKAARKGEPKAHGTARIETFWRVRGTSGHVFPCAVYRTEGALELRVGDEKEPISVVEVNDIDDARHRAENLKRLMIEQGHFEEVALDSTQ